MMQTTKESNLTKNFNTQDIEQMDSYSDEDSRENIQTLSSTFVGLNKNTQMQHIDDYQRMYSISEGDDMSDGGQSDQLMKTLIMAQSKIWNADKDALIPKISNKVIPCEKT